MPTPGTFSGPSGHSRERVDLDTSALSTPKTIWFGHDYRTFVFRFLQGAVGVPPVGGQVYVALGAKEAMAGASGSQLTTLTNVVDPLVVRKITLDTPVDQIHVWHEALAGTTLEVFAINGDSDEAATASEIASAINTAAPAVTFAAVAVTVGAPATVVMGPASAAIILANASRKALTLENTGGVPVALRFAAAAAVFASGLILPVGGFWETGEGLTIYRGEIRGITGGGAGEIRYQEST